MNSISFYRLRSVIFLMITLCVQLAEAGEVIWLEYQSPVKYRSFTCGNKTEFEFRASIGLLINGQGEVIERFDEPVWVRRVSPELMLFSTRPVFKDPPIRTLIGDGKRFSIHTDLVPSDLGKGITMFAVSQSRSMGRGGIRIEHEIDPSSNPSDPLLYLDAELNPIENIESLLGLEFLRWQVIGLVGTMDKPVVRLNMGKNGPGYSMQTILVGEVQKPYRYVRQVIHHRYLMVSDGRNIWTRKLFLYDPIEDRIVREVENNTFFAVNGWPYLAFKNQDHWALFDEDFNELIELEDGLVPVYVTDSGILICAGTPLRGPEGAGNYRAFRVSSENDPLLEEVDVSWVTSVINVRYNPYSAGGLRVYSRDGNEYMLVGDSQSEEGAAGRLLDSGMTLRQLDINQYAIYSADGEQIKVFDLDALFVD